MKLNNNQSNCLELRSTRVIRYHSRCLVSPAHGRKEKPTALRQVNHCCSVLTDKGRNTAIITTLTSRRRRRDLPLTPKWSGVAPYLCPGPSGQNKMSWVVQRLDATGWGRGGADRPYSSLSARAASSAHLMFRRTHRQKKRCTLHLQLFNLLPNHKEIVLVTKTFTCNWRMLTIKLVNSEGSFVFTASLVLEAPWPHRRAEPILPSFLHNQSRTSDRSTQCLVFSQN